MLPKISFWSEVAFLYTPYNLLSPGIAFGKPPQPPKGWL